LPELLTAGSETRRISSSRFFNVFSRRPSARKRSKIAIGQPITRKKYQKKIHFSAENDRTRIRCEKQKPLVVHRANQAQVKTLAEEKFSGIPYENRVNA
jgi:hypothetical protein